MTHGTAGTVSARTAAPRAASALRLVVLTSPAGAGRGHTALVRPDSAQMLNHRDVARGGQVGRRGTGGSRTRARAQNGGARRRRCGCGSGARRAGPDAHLGAPAARPRSQAASRPAGTQGVRGETTGHWADKGSPQARGQQQAVSVEKRIAGPYVREVALIWSRSYEASSYRWYFEGFARWLDLTFKR